MTNDKNNRIAALRDRADMLAKSRAFFQERNVMEVDTPAITRLCSVDAHIDLIPCTVMGNETRWLISSPEYCMKRLIAEGIGDIYQLSHVWRDFEYGSKHNPEFMMAEWYRLGFSYEEMIAETQEYIKLFLGDIQCSTISYQEAFIVHTGIDPFNCNESTLLDFIELKDRECPYDPELNNIDDLLTFVLATFIEPQIGQDGLCALTYFPPSQAALAKVRVLNGIQFAERFEVFYRGMELANGYHELQDAHEQLKRLEDANSLRKNLKKSPLPIDMRFIESLKIGMPSCCGVAVGFDRLMMLKTKAATIGDVISFDWREA